MADKKKEGGQSKTARASVQAGTSSGSTSTRSPQHELQIFYRRTAKGGLGQRKRLVPVGTPITEIESI